MLQQRKKVLASYDEQMDTNCRELINAVEKQLKRGIDNFYQEIMTAFRPIAAFCISQRRMFEPLLERATQVQQQLELEIENMGGHLNAYTSVRTS